MITNHFPGTTMKNQLRHTNNQQGGVAVDLLTIILHLHKDWNTV